MASPNHAAQDDAVMQVEDTQGENLESEVITESGGVGAGAGNQSIMIGPADVRLQVNESEEGGQTKGVKFGKGKVISEE